MSVENKELKELLDSLRAKKKKPSLAELMNKLLLIIAFGFVAAIFHAFVVAKLWGWYAVPAFGFPHISLLTAYGMCILFAAVRGFKKTNVEISDESFAVTILSPLAFSGMLLFIGWAVQAIVR